MSERRLEQLAALAFAAADVLFEVDRAFRIRNVGGAIRRLTGHEAKAVRSLSLFDLIAPADRVFLRRVVEAFDANHPVGRTSVRFLHGADKMISTILGMGSMPGSGGERLVTATILDRSFVVCPDSGGFLDRNAFIDLVRRLAPQSGETTEFNVVMLALPQLMQNPALKETALGAAFLTEIEAILRLNSEGGIVTKLSDDAFAYLQKVSTDPELVQKKIAAATDALLTKPQIQKLPLDSSLLEHKELTTALSHALSVFADGQERDQTAFDTLPDCLAATANQERKLVAACRSIIEDRTFFQVLQPILALKTGVIQHYEVLTRFAEGVARGISSTGDFVKIAEQIGMINTFDLLNCVETIRLLQHTPPGISVALNVSGRSVQSPEFAVRLMNILESPDLKVDPSRLLVEITETRGISNFDEATGLIQKLVRRGHKICLDDFGAGAMSFEYLRRFSVNYIKIDGNFFRNAMNSGRDRILIRAIARCAFELGCRTVAEMIETDMEAALARELGIDCGQGWLFGKPVTAEMLLASLRKTQDGRTTRVHAAAPSLATVSSQTPARHGETQKKDGAWVNFAHRAG